MRARIPDAPIEHLSLSSKLGYGRSKLGAEHVIQAAVDTVCAKATILRIGQIVGDQNMGFGMKGDDSNDCSERVTNRDTACLVLDRDCE